MKASGFLLSTLLVAGAQGPVALAAPVAAAQTSDVELRRVAREFAQLSFARRPWLATERGWTDQDSGLGRYGFEERALWLEALEVLGERLDELDRRDLSAPRVAALEALRAQLTVQEVLAETRAVERWNTSGYVERVELVLRSHMLGEAISQEDGLRIARVLAELPAYWKDAEASLVAPIDDWSREALGHLDTLDHYLRTGREDILASLPESSREFAEADFNQALDATRAFREWLIEPHRVTSPALTRTGARHWLELVAGASGSSWDIERIKWELLRDLALSEREHGPRWRSDERKMGADPGLVAELNRELTERAGAAMKLAHDAGILAAPADRLPVRFTLGDSPVRFGRGALFARGEDDALEVVLDPGLMVGADDATLTAIAIRHGLPGETLFRQHAAVASGVLPRYLWNRATEEGWGLYVLDWMLRIDWVENSLRADDAFVSEVARLRVIEAARLLAALELHTQDFSIEEAAEGFRRRTGLGLDRAHQEVRRAIIDPLLGIGYLGWIELGALEHRFRAGTGAKRSLARTVGRILDQPHLRPRDFEGWLLGQNDR